MTLTEQLNLYKVDYTAGPEGVQLEACPDDSLFDDEGLVIDPYFNTFLDVFESFNAYFDDDPRDRRAGLVCYVEYNGETAWYDANGDCCWVVS